MELKATDVFADWLVNLRDKLAYRAIVSRLHRLQHGLAGDAKPVGKGVSELRIDVGAGYRVYYQRKGECLLLLLCGGDKRTQSRDIKLAIELSQSFGG
jgi:putative addiction module killer protein